ncbi:MAG TPA: hypothetical protein VFW15_04945 [Thermoanaerobaculia bacterium]|nr:hypothetical protein [Thermoanaerobaculia bacterium]
MPKTNHFARSGWFWIFVLVSSLVFPALELGAQSLTPTPTPPDLKLKVKVVEVTKSGTNITVNPVKVKLKRKEEIVVWVTNGESMRILFKPGNPEPGDPFTDLVCRGRICGVLTPPDVAPGVFNYKVVVDGAVLDPNVEVIP